MKSGRGSEGMGAGRPGSLGIGPEGLDGRGSCRDVGGPWSGGTATWPGQVGGTDARPSGSISASTFTFAPFFHVPSDRLLPHRGRRAEFSPSPPRTQAAHADVLARWSGTSACRLECVNQHSGRADASGQGGDRGLRPLSASSSRSRSSPRHSSRLTVMGLIPMAPPSRR